MRLASVVLALALVTTATASAQEVLSPYDQAPAIPPAAVVPPPPVMPPSPPGATPMLPPPPIAPLPPPLVVAPPSCLTLSCGPLRYREVEQPRYGLMIAGIAILGASWSINAASGWVADEWRLAVPVAGPFMEIQRVNDGIASRFLVGMLVFDGLIETAGATMMLAGAVSRHKVRVLDQTYVSLVPSAGPGSAGLAAAGRF